MLALVVLGVVAVVANVNLAEATARDEVEQRTSVFARSVVGPLVDHRAPQGDARGLLDTVIRNRMSDGSIVHVKVWAADGRIIWSDETGLIDQVFALGDDELEALASHGVVSDLSDLSKPENAGESQEAPLIEVYAATEDSTGLPILFESYWASDRLTAHEGAILTRSMPLTLLALLVFQVVVLVLARRLSLRVERGQVERDRLLRDAVGASELERSRLAQDLHDGVIQDLTGLRYALPSIAAQLPDQQSSSKRILDRMNDILQRDISALRTVLTDIYPADLKGDGLVREIHRIADRAGESGLVVEVRVDPQAAEISLDVSRLAYRIVREGLRNVVAHAQATHALVRVDVVDQVVSVSVTDDGRGLVPHGDGQGHVGLRLLGETLTDVGGSLDLRAPSQGGVVLAATFPRALGQPGSS
jgi:signal transduction histidine kinase